MTIRNHCCQNCVPVTHDHIHGRMFTPPRRLHPCRDTRLNNTAWRAACHAGVALHTQTLATAASTITTVAPATTASPRIIMAPPAMTTMATTTIFTNGVPATTTVALATATAAQATTMAALAMNTATSATTMPAVATTMAAPATTTTLPATIITTPATISVTPATTTTASPMIVIATLATTVAAAPVIAAPVMAAAYPIHIVVTTKSMVSTKPRHPHRGNLLDLLACPTKRDKLGTMKICLINVQLVRNKVSSLCDFISDHDFDILTMTENWLCDTPRDSQIIRALTMPGYTFTQVPWRQHTNTTARGGGVAIMHKSNIKMTSKSSWKAKSFENIELTLSSSLTVKLVVIYRPPPSKRNKSTVGLFLSEFQDFLQHHMIKSRNILIVGDFNFHYEDPLNLMLPASMASFRPTHSASRCRGPLTWMAIH